MRSQQPLKFTRDIAAAVQSHDKGIRAIKYHPADAGQYILLRYADVVLMKAEAQLRSGKAADALATVNALRAKRGAKAVPLMKKACSTNAAANCTGKAFAVSHQVRFGTWDDTWTKKSVTEAFRVLYPIPQRALDSNPNLKQNDGY